jgi:hypothetical protein
MSVNQLIGREQCNPMKKRRTRDKRRTKVFKGKHERELERKKWNINVNVGAGHQWNTHDGQIPS